MGHEEIIKIDMYRLFKVILIIIICFVIDILLVLIFYSLKIESIMVLGLIMVSNIFLLFVFWPANINKHKKLIGIYLLSNKNEKIKIIDKIKFLDALKYSSYRVSPIGYYGMPLQGFIKSYYYKVLTTDEIEYIVKINSKKQIDIIG